MSPRAGLDSTMIIAAAADLADQHGADAVTLASLAKQLNIRPPSLYNHVNGLPDIRRQLAIYGFEQLYNAMRQAAASAAGREAILQAGAAYVTFARQHPGLYEATLRAPAQDPDVQKAGEQLVTLTIRLLADFGLQEAATIHAVRGLRSLLHGFASLEQQGGFNLQVDRTESLHWILDTYIAGFRSSS